MTSPTLLILAAGAGSRYGGLKQIDPVGPNGEIIIDYSILDALGAGFGKLVFVIRAETEQLFRTTIGARFEDRVAVEYVFQDLHNIPDGFEVPAGRTKPWGTTQALLAAADVIREPFAVINADDFYGAGSYRLLAQHLTAGTTDYAMAGFILRNTLSEFGPVARGVCELQEDNLLARVVELINIRRDGNSIQNTDGFGHTQTLTGDELVSMNMWGFTPRIFAQLKMEFRRFLELRSTDLRAESYLPNTVDSLVSCGAVRVRVLRTEDKWFGVTYREDRGGVVENIARLINDGCYPR